MSDYDTCPECGHSTSITRRKCSKCRKEIWYPNVKLAELYVEQRALERRCACAKKKADKNGSSQRLKEFEEKVENTCLVINMKEKLLLEFLRDTDKIYENYHVLARDEIYILPPQIERIRIAVDGVLFPGFMDQIRFAALSLDGHGLKSYGGVSVRLDDTYLKESVSFLEENSFGFMKKHGIRVASPSTPKGYLAVWQTRGKLAVAKLAESVNNSTQEADFAKLMVKSTMDKNTDEFIEAHIYGEITREDFKSVKFVSKVSGKVARARKEKFGELLAKRNITLDEN